MKNLTYFLLVMSFIAIVAGSVLFYSAGEEDRIVITCKQKPTVTRVGELWKVVCINKGDVRDEPLPPVYAYPPPTEEPRPYP